jgi:hypothetical protein
VGQHADLPEPLRDLVVNREAEDFLAPDDPHRNAYARELNALRRDPKPDVFREIAAHMGERDTGYTPFEFEGIAEAVLGASSRPMDDFSNADTRAEPWQTDKLHRALRYAVAALDQTATRDALYTMVEVIMEPLGGGKLQVTGADGRSVFSVEVHTGRDESYSYVANADQYSLPEFKRMIQVALQAKYPVLNSR